MNDTNSVAAILWKQIGNGTLAMLGASGLVNLPNGVQFSIKGCRYGNKLVIKLGADDMYTVELWKIGRKATAIAKVDEAGYVFADALHSTIETMTGLYTRL